MVVGGSLVHRALELGAAPLTGAVDRRRFRFRAAKRGTLDSRSDVGGRLCVESGPVASFRASTPGPFSPLSWTFAAAPIRAQRDPPLIVPSEFVACARANGDAFDGNRGRPSANVNVRQRRRRNVERCRRCGLIDLKHGEDVRCLCASGGYVATGARMVHVCLC